jgi:glycosyltransferase involved in cell wall biosynthesis
MISGLGELLFVTHHRRFKTVARPDPWARELVRRGYKVTLLCTANRARFRSATHDESGVSVVEAPDLLPGRLRSGWDPWGMLWRIAFLSKHRFDLVHAFETRPTTIYPVLHALRRTPAPLVIDWNDWWGRGGLINELRPPWYRFLFGGIETYFEEHFRCRANALTVISQALAERATGLGFPHERIFKILGACDTTFFADTPPQRHRARFGLPENRLLVGLAAADATMDVQLVLHAMRRVVANAPDTMLIMTGNKPSGFDDVVQTLGLTSCVKHLGFLPYADLPSVLSCVDMFVLPFPEKPANVGRWPHKMAEYMSVARPTVTNPTGEVGALLREHDVGLAAEETAEDFADKILKLIQDPALRRRMGRDARRIAETCFTWDKAVDELESVYEYALSVFNANGS